MGKAVIVSDLGEGEYTALIKRDTERALNTIDELDVLITSIESKEVIQAASIIDYKAALDSARIDLSTAINAGATLDELPPLVEKIGVASKKLAVENNKLNSIKFDKLSAQKRRSFLSDNLPTEQTITVWCADYTEGLTGEVGTIEVNGDTSANPIIYPAGDAQTDAAYSAIRDNKVQPIISSGAAGSYFNRAILPGWQKWKPTYRVGTITSRTGNLCDLDLDEALSSQQNLDIGQAASLSGVPIEYLASDGLVFEPGDRVVVKFINQDWAQPKVIGFESNPKPEYQLFILNDLFEFSTVQNTFVHRYNVDDGFIDIPLTDAARGYTRNLERVGKDLFWFYQSDLVGVTTRQIMKNDAQVANASEAAFAVNKSYLYTHKYDSSSYDRTIYRRDLDGNIINSFQAVIPGKALVEEIPTALGANESYLYIAITYDPANNGSDYIIRYDLDGSNPTVLIEFAYTTAPANAPASWRFMRVTDERIYIPRGDTSQGAPIYCKVYDSVTGAYIDQFGPLPQSSAYLGPSYNEALACAANDKYFVWLYDDRNFGYFTYRWERVVTRDSGGAILTEAFTPIPQTNIDLNGGDFKGCLGGLCL